ncbi:MAG: OmpA family protein [Spirochaetaceae bacterium]|nr:OmpA family protein [Spirochaetaceae bacterium]
MLKKLSLILLLLTTPLLAFDFRFRHNEGDQFRFLSTVQTSIFSNDNAPPQHVEFINRLTYRVAEVDEHGSGRLVGTTATSQRLLGSNAATLWTTDYEVDFWRNVRGGYTVAPTFHMPMVRNVPFFPEGPVNPGFRWAARGETALDISQLLGLTAPFIVPIIVNHHYMGPVEIDGRIYQKINVQYSYSENLPRPFGRVIRPNEAIAQRIEAEHNQFIFWDEELGQPAFYEEEFIRRFTFSNGIILTEVGFAEAHLIEAIPMNRAELLAELEEQTRRLNFNIEVEESADGIRLIMDSIQFVVNSAEFLAGEEVKLHQIGQLLQAHHNRDIAITGHAAAAGNPQFEQVLSEERALAVANWLIANGYRSADNIITQGRGSSEPLVSNATPQGQARNRRVEITILEN